MSRWGAVLTLVALVGVVTLAPEAPDALADVSGDDYPRALLALAGLGQLTLSALVLLAAAATPVPALRDRLPRVARVLLLSGAGGALMLAPAHAEEPTEPTSVHRLDGLRLPDRAVGDPPAEAPLVATDVEAPVDAPDRIEVRAGDTLWSIAARHLSSGATAADVAREWPRWYAANRDVIGDDPDLILPHQQLAPPGKDRP